jgi:hypothetical protein
MLASLVIVVLCLLFLNVSAVWSGLLLVVGGIVAHGLNNILTRVIRPAARGERWAVSLVGVLGVVPILTIGAYVAGIALLAIGGATALWRLMFPSAGN